MLQALLNKYNVRQYIGRKYLVLTKDSYQNFADDVSRAVAGAVIGVGEGRGSRNYFKISSVKKANKTKAKYG